MRYTVEIAVEFETPLSQPLNDAVRQEHEAQLSDVFRDALFQSASHRRDTMIRVRGVVIGKLRS
jgi:hypothetical protein